MQINRKNRLYGENMSGLRKLTLGFGIWLGTLGAAGAAEPLFETFAACAGRFSAELEHAWLMGTQDFTETSHRRTQFVSLVEAATPHDLRRRALEVRIDAKMAHAQVLTRATFSTQPSQQVWAAQRAAASLRHCEDLLLDS